MLGQQPAQLPGGAPVAGVGPGTQYLFGLVQVAAPDQQPGQPLGGVPVAGGGAGAQPVQVAACGPGRSWYGFAPCGWPVSGGEEDQQGTGVGVGPGSGEDAAEVLADDPDDGRDDDGKDQGGPGAGDRQEDARRDEAEDDGEDDGHRGALARDQVRCVPVE